MKHELRTWPNFFWDVANGKKNFEVRKNDRGFQVNDVLKLQEYKPVEGSYTCCIMLKKVSYVLEGGDFGIEEGYCVLGLEVKEVKENAD